VLRHVLRSNVLCAALCVTHLNVLCVAVDRMNVKTDCRDSRFHVLCLNTWCAAVDRINVKTDCRY